MSYEYRIPAEHRNRFRECEYLESTGTQWIDTGITLSNESEVRCDFVVSNWKNVYAVLYINEDNVNARFSSFIEMATHSSTHSRWDFASQMVNASALDLNKNYSVIHNSTGVTLNGKQIVSFSSTDAFETGGTLTLWGTRSAYNSICKIYSFSISRNGVKQCDYVPAYDTEEKRPCMFDLVTNTPKYNLGTGEFKYRYAALPALFEQVEYLEGTGTQWIQCGNFPENEVVATFDSQFTRIVAERQLFGLSSNNPYMGVSATGLFELFSVSADTNRHTYQISCNREKNECIRSIVDLSLSSSTVAAWSDPQTIALSLMPFSLEHGSFITKHLRCYSARVVAGGTLAMDLIPCRDIDDRPCMFDLVSQRAYYNQGTGEFIAPDVNRFPEGYTRVRYLEANGTNTMEISFEEVENVEAGIITQWTDTGEGGGANRQLIGFNDLNCWWGIDNGAWVNVNGGDDLLAKQNFTVKMTGQSGWIDANNGLGRKTLWSDATRIPYKHLGLCTIGGFGSRCLCSNRIFYTYITTDGRLLRRLYPCLDEKGKPCLFDIVEQVPFYGTGKFIAPGYDELPEGYTRCKYLESTGTQYIDTGIKLSNESRVICEFSNAFSIDGMIFGAKQTSPKNIFCATASVCWFSFGNNSINVGSISTGKLDANGNQWTLNEYVHTFDDVTFETPVSALLFTAQSPTEIDSRYFRGRIYSFSISRAGVLQCNYIPALDPDGRPCMYDTVTNRAFYNQNTGDDFLYEVLYKPIPKGYKRCKYLESSGTQYIDTGIKLSSESEVKCNYMLIGSGGMGGFVFGARESLLLNAFALFGDVGFSTYAIYATYSDTTTFPKFKIGQKSSIYANKNNWTIDELSCSFTESIFETPVTAYLFALRDESFGVLPDKRTFIGRIYSFSISSNGVLQQYLIPCLDNTGKPCMYDAITGISLYNLGTGDDFSYELLYELPAGYERCEYLESTGRQYIATGITASADINVKTTWEWTGQLASYQYVYGGNSATFGALIATPTTGMPHFYANGKALAVQNAIAGIQSFEHTWYDVTHNGVTQTFREHDELTTWPSLNLYSAGTVTNAALIRIYSFSISKSGVKQCDLVPCRDEFGTPCMYDLITGNTLYNKGQGEFIAPKVKYRHVPASFRQIEYLESDGNQFIELPVHLNQDSQVIMSYELPESPSEEFPIFGASSSVDSFVYKVGPSSWTAINGAYTASQSLPTTSFTSVWMQASHIMVNDKNYPWSEAIEQEYDAGYCALFGQSTSADPVKSGKVRIGCVAIYRKGILESMLVPCRDDRLRPCMYDVISQTAHYNSGTGEFSGPIGGGLPAGYLRLDYLESTGTQYIDTGIKLSNESEVNCDYLINQNTSPNAIFGARDDYTLNAYSLYSPNSTGYIVYSYGTSGVSSSLGVPVVNEKYKASTYDGVLTINGTSATKLASEAFTGAYSCLLFAVNTKGNHHHNPKLQGRVYSFSISSNGIPQQYLIPALDPTGKPCMYDLCYNKAYYNKASGADFSYQLPAGGYGSIGNKIKALGGGILPNGYKQVNYLESTGSQWIDTGITLNGDSVVSIVYQNTIDTTESGCIFGARQTNTQNAYALYDRSWIGGGGNIYFGYNDQTISVGRSLGDDPITRAFLDGPNWLLENATQKITHSFVRGEFTTLTAYLFTYHLPNGADSRGYLGRIFSLSIKNAGVQQLNLIPCLDPSGRPCMYDTVTGQPKYNQGSGEFLWG